MPTNQQSQRARIASAVGFLAGAFWLIAATGPAGGVDRRRPTPSPRDTIWPATPTECIDEVVHPAVNRLHAWVNDSNAKVLDAIPYTRLQELSDSVQYAAAASCADGFSITTTAHQELPKLIELWIMARKTTPAREAVTYSLNRATTDSARIAVLTHAMSAFMRSHEPRTVRRAIRDHYLERLDAMGDVALIARIRAHVSCYDFMETDPEDRRTEHLRTAIALAGRVVDPERRREMAGSLAFAFIALARRALEERDLRYAEKIADSGMKVLGDVPAELLWQLPAYALLGTKAAPIEAPHWYHAPKGFSKYEPGKDGKVTVVELTSYW